MVIFTLTVPGSWIQKSYNDALQMVIINIFYSCLRLFRYITFMFLKWHRSYWNELSYGLLYFSYHIPLLIPLPNLILSPSMHWVNHSKDPLYNNLRTTSSDIEGITHAQCKNSRIIFQLFSLSSSYTWHSFPSIWMGHGCSHSYLHSKSTALAVPYFQSIPLIVQGPL